MLEGFPKGLSFWSGSFLWGCSFGQGLLKRLALLCLRAFQKGEPTRGRLLRKPSCTSGLGRRVVGLLTQGRRFLHSCLSKNENYGAGLSAQSRSVLPPVANLRSSVSFSTVGHCRVRWRFFPLDRRLPLGLNLPSSPLRRSQFGISLVLFLTGTIDIDAG